MRFRLCSARPIVAGMTAVGVIAMGAGCSNAPSRSAERFCGELTAHADAIRLPPGDIPGITALIQLYSRMGEVAPLEIERSWAQLIVNLKTANAIDVNDPASAQLVADTAYASQQSAQAVVTWAQQTCGLDLGPAGEVPPGPQLVSTTTTIAG